MNDNPFRKRKKRGRGSRSRSIKPPGRVSRFYSSRYFVIVILFAIVVGTGLLATRMRVKTKERVEELAASKEPAPVYSELELALKSRDKQRLRDMIEQLKVEPGEEFAVQLEKIKKRLKVSEELLTFPDDPEARQFGLLSGLDALTLWHTLNVIYQVEDLSMQTKMQDFAGQHVQDADSKVAARANYVLALVEIHRFIVNKKPEDYEQGLGHYNQTLEKVGDELVEAIRISNLVSLLSKSGHEQESAQMWEAFYRRFGDAQNEAIQSLALKAYDQFVFSGSPVALSMEKIIQGDSQAVAGFQQQVDDLVSAHALSNSGFDMLLAMLEVLVQNGETTEVQEILSSLLGRLPEITGMADPQQVEKKINATLNRASLMGQVVGFDGMHSGSGRKFDESMLDGSMVVVVFWSPKNQLSMERLSSVHKMISLFDSGQINLVAVSDPARQVPAEDYSQEGQNEVPQIDPRAVEFMASLSNCIFLEVDRNQPKLSGLIEQLGPPFLPYILMVDADHSVIALNPRPDNLVKMLGQNRGQ